MSYQTPRGTYDVLPQDMAPWHALEELIRSLSAIYHYEEIRTPLFESTGVFARENDTSDMVQKEMYTFTMGDESYTLRPEGTAGVVRAFVEHKLYGNPDLPQKFYYCGPMFRHERPQKGRQRQFWQYGVENIGVRSSLADAEVIALGYSLVKAVGIQSVKVCVNTLGDATSRARYKEALQEHFRPVLSTLCGDCQRRFETNPLRLLDCKVDHESEAVKTAPSLMDYLTPESKAYFQEVLKNLDALGIPYEIDNRLVRGLDYYTDTVFEVVSTKKESGAQSTIFGGGRYDGLVEYFGGPSMSGVGFAIGLERLLILAEADGCELTQPKEEGLDVYVMALGDCGTLPLEAATTARAAGYVTELNVQTERSMKAQFKSVDRSKAKVVLIIGENEAKENKITVKAIASQTQVVVNLDQLVEQLDTFMEEA